MKCLVTLPDTSTISRNVWWKEFKANCPKVNSQCSGKSKAFVPAVTVCSQGLFTGTCDSVAMEC